MSKKQLCDFGELKYSGKRQRDLVIKKTTETEYECSVRSGSSRWNFVIHNNVHISVSGVWVQVSGLGAVPIKTSRKQDLWRAVLDKICGEYVCELRGKLIKNDK